MFLTRKTVASVAYSPCGKWIASSSWDQTVRIWDAATGAPVGSPLRGHSKDNPECACTFDDFGNLKQRFKQNPECSVNPEWIQNPECPVRGHRYDPFPFIECLLL